MLGRLAKRVGNAQLCARYQGWLIDAIPGITCPYPIHGPIAEKILLIDILYVQWIQGYKHTLEQTTHYIWEIMYNVCQ